MPGRGQLRRATRDRGCGMASLYECKQRHHKQQSDQQGDRRPGGRRYREGQGHQEEHTDKRSRPSAARSVCIGGWKGWTLAGGRPSFPRCGRQIRPRLVTDSHSMTRSRLPLLSLLAEIPDSYRLRIGVVDPEPFPILLMSAVRCNSRGLCRGCPLAARAKAAGGSHAYRRACDA